MSTFFDYAVRHGLALFPLCAGSKDPALPKALVPSWKTHCSRDSKQWEAWAAQFPGCNFGIVAFKSGLLICDIDLKKVGAQAAWAAWRELCAECGLPAPLMPQVITASGGWHCYTQLPTGFDWRGLKQITLKGCVDIRVVGFTVAAGSFYDGTAKGEASGYYTLVESAINADLPPTPQRLLDLCKRMLPTFDGTGKGGVFEGTRYRVDDTIALLIWMRENEMFDDYWDWFHGLAALRAEFGDEHGPQLARLITWADDIESGYLDRKRLTLSLSRRPGDVTLKTLFKIARDAGWRGVVGRTWDEALSQLADAPGMPAPAPLNGELIRGGGVSDDALAMKFSAMYADSLRYTAKWGKWHRFDGIRWREDSTVEVYDLVRGIMREQANLVETSDAKKLRSKQTIAAVESLARSDRRHAMTVDRWDADPMWLNTPGGIVDLATGKIRETRPEDYCTKMTAVAPGGDCPLWLAFLNRIMNGDAEMVAYLRRVVGYCLTGVTVEHALFFAWGTGANGKSVFIDTIAGMLGDYHCTTPSETFMASVHERHPTELADLQGARLVTSSETEQGKRWNEERIKSLTGDKNVKARFMRQDLFRFTPQMKIFIVGNHKPGLRSIDEGIRRRLNLLSFTVTIPAAERDRGLLDKLQAEWPGILLWAIQGCLEWQQKGLAPPPAVTNATVEYFEAQDALSAWIEDCCDLDENAWTPRSMLFSSWSKWAEEAGEWIGSAKDFYQKLEIRSGLKPHKRDGDRGFFGIKFRPVVPPQAPVRDGSFSMCDAAE